MIWPFGDGPLGVWLERRRAMQDMKRAAALEDAILPLRDDNPLHRAKVSIEVDDPKAAREFLAIARVRMPGFVLKSPDTVEILLGLRAFDELESHALTGAKRFPKDPQYLEAYALAAERRRDLEEAVRRWAAVEKKFPHRGAAYVATIGCLRQLGRLDEVEPVLARALRMMPEDMTLLLEWGRVADARGDWQESYRRWDSLKDRHPEGYVCAAYALHKLGRTAEAEALLADGRSRHPIYLGLAVMQARIAEESGDIAQALQRWSVVRMRFPLDQAGYVDAIRLLRQRQDWAEADTIALAAIDRFPAYDWPLVEYATLAHMRQDWPEAAKRWAVLGAAFPARQDARQREAEALAAAGG